MNNIGVADATHTAGTLSAAIADMKTTKYDDPLIMSQDLVRLINGQPTAAEKKEVIAKALAYENLPYDEWKHVTTTFEPQPETDEVAYWFAKVLETHPDLRIGLPGNVLSLEQYDEVMDKALIAHEAFAAFGEVGQVVHLAGLLKLAPIYRAIEPAPPKTDVEKMRQILVAHPDAFATVQALADQQNVSSKQAIAYILAQDYDPELTQALLGLLVEDAVRDEHQRWCPGCGDSGSILDKLGLALALSTLLDDEDDEIEIL